jgi:hypothetical protein
VSSRHAVCVLVLGVVWAPTQTPEKVRLFASRSRLSRSYPAAGSALDPASNPGLYDLRDELRHDSGHVPGRLQRQQFAYRSRHPCRGVPSRSQSHPMLYQLSESTA